MFIKNAFLIFIKNNSIVIEFVIICVMIEGKIDLYFSVRVDKIIPINIQGIIWVTVPWNIPNTNEEIITPK